MVTVCHSLTPRPTTLSWHNKLVSWRNRLVSWSIRLVCSVAHSCSRSVQKISHGSNSLRIHIELKAVASRSLNLARHLRTLLKPASCSCTYYTSTAAVKARMTCNATLLKVGQENTRPCLSVAVPVWIATGECQALTGS